jgi:hypothetical protein
VCAPFFFFLSTNDRSNVMAYLIEGNFQIELQFFSRVFFK